MIVNLLLSRRLRESPDRTRERRQETFVGVGEGFPAATPRLEAHLQAEPEACRAPPGHRRLHARSDCSAGIGTPPLPLPPSPAFPAVAAPHAAGSAPSPARLEQHCPTRGQELPRRV